MNKSAHILAVVLAGCVLTAAHAAGPGPGDQAPLRLGVDRDGNAMETSAFAGKVLVVTFWATWCAPCRKELPMLEGITWPRR